VNQTKAFLAALAFLAAGTYVARKYLSSDARIALGVVAAMAHLA